MGWLPRRSRLWAALWGAALLLTVGVPWGAPPPPPSPAGNVELGAELLELDVHDQTAHLSGNVTLTRGGDLTLRCPKLDVRYEIAGPKVVWARGSGGVVVEVKGVHGEAPEFELDLAQQRLHLRGGVRLFRGQGWVVAEGAEIDLASAKVVMNTIRASLPVGNALPRPAH